MSKLMIMSVAQIAWHITTFLLTKKYFRSLDEYIFFGFVCTYACYSIICQTFILPEICLNLTFGQRYMYFHFVVIGISKTYMMPYFLFNYIGFRLDYFSGIMSSIICAQNADFSLEMQRVNSGSSVIMQQLFGLDYVDKLPFKRSEEDEKIIAYLRSLKNSNQKLFSTHRLDI